MNAIKYVLPFICCINLCACTHVKESSSSELKTKTEQTKTEQPRTEQPKPLLTTASATVMTEAEFSSCISSLSAKAKAAGISSSTISSSLAKARFNARVIELDRQQPEFTTSFADYFNRRVTDQRVEQGKALMVKHRALLDRVSKQYGVPAPYILAFWGLETNYGSFLGNMSAVDTLSTLACDQRRSDFFTTELINSLRILDGHDVKPDKLIGSWAGAMGNFQFMPSAFLKYAVDYDGDNKRDLWSSTPDAMASAANFLKGLGWQTSDRWGQEVKLPTGFSFLEAGLKNSRPISEWRKLGVKSADNTPLTTVDGSASLLVPSGHKGPAFLVYDNFNVIMRWNRSEFYALAVGNLADRIAGAGKLIQPPPEDAPRLRRNQVILLQEQLNKKGFNTGTPDGILGPGTRRAISEFQNQQGMIADGFPDRKTLGLLGVNADFDKN